MIPAAEDAVRREVEKARDDPEKTYVRSRGVAIRVHGQATSGEADLRLNQIPDAGDVGLYLSRHDEELGLLRYRGDGLPTRWAFGRVEELEENDSYEAVESDDVENPP